MDAISVEVRRGRVVEAVHRVHARSTAGDVFGDDLRCFLRSSSKPIQAIPFLEGYGDLSDDELAIACASHQAEPAQLAAVKKVLARAGATADDLENGTQPGRPEGKVGHTCSGKHAGMLAACAATGWELAGYRLAEHPLQQRILELHSVPETRGAETAVDGCGVPTFAMTLRQMAELLTRTPQRIADAMRGRPELVGGQGAVDTDLMRALPGTIAKYGAEGLLCVVTPDGVGWAVKVGDGAKRALRPALAALFAIDAFRSVPVDNSRGEIVGEIVVESAP